MSNQEEDDDENEEERGAVLEIVVDFAQDAPESQQTDHFDGAEYAAVSLDERKGVLKRA
jgi:hypothetical protein